MIGGLMIVRFWMLRRRNMIYGCRIMMRKWSRSVRHKRDVFGPVPPPIKSCVLILRNHHTTTKVFIVTMVNIHKIDKQIKRQNETSGVTIGFHIQYNIPQLQRVDIPKELSAETVVQQSTNSTHHCASLYRMEQEKNSTGLDDLQQVRAHGGSC